MPNLLEDARKKVEAEKAALHAELDKQDAETMKLGKKIKKLLADNGMESVHNCFVKCSRGFFEVGKPVSCDKFEIGRNSYSEMGIMFGDNKNADMMYVKVAWYQTFSWYVPCYAVEIIIVKPYQIKLQVGYTGKPEERILVSQRDKERDYANCRFVGHFLRSDNEVWEIIKKELMLKVQMVADEYFRTPRWIGGRLVH